MQYFCNKNSNFISSTNNVQLSTNQVLPSNQMQFQLDALKAMPYGDSPLFKRFYKVCKLLKLIFIHFAITYDVCFLI